MEGVVNVVLLVLDVLLVLLVVPAWHWGYVSSMDHSCDSLFQVKRQFPGHGAGVVVVVVVVVVGVQQFWQMSPKFTATHFAASGMYRARGWNRRE